MVPLPKVRLMLLLCLSQATPSRAIVAIERPASTVTSFALRLASSFSPQDQQFTAPPAPEELFRLGKQALARGDFSAAEAYFHQVIALDPASSPAHVNLAVTYMREKRWNDALLELRQAQTLSPEEPGILLNIGLAYYRKNDFAAAIAPFTSFLHKAPNSLQARYLLGLCYFFTDEYKEAATILAPLWDQEATHLNYLYVLAIAASKSSDSTLQQRAFNQMLAIGQNSPEFHLYMGKAWLAQDDTAKALEEFQTAIQARPDLPLAHYFLGRTLLEQHAYPQAEAELLKDVTLEPDFAYNYEDLGILYAQLDQPEKAERYFKQAIARNSSLVNSCFGLAKLYRKSGRLQDALKLLDAAEALAPTSASLHYTRGQVLAALGESAEAHVEFQQSAHLLGAFNQRLQQGFSGDRSADAQGAAEQ